MKLKTLKDFENSKLARKSEYIIPANLPPSWWVKTEDLRQEAIKRAKYYKKQIDCEEEPKECAYWEGKYDECIDFANLTEEDLNET